MDVQNKRRAQHGGEEHGELARHDTGSTDATDPVSMTEQSHGDNAEQQN